MSTHALQYILSLYYVARLPVIRLHFYSVAWIWKSRLNIVFFLYIIVIRITQILVFTVHCYWISCYVQIEWKLCLLFIAYLTVRFPVHWEIVTFKRIFSELLFVCACVQMMTIFRGNDIDYGLLIRRQWILFQSNKDICSAFLK